MKLVSPNRKTKQKTWPGEKNPPLGMQHGHYEAALRDENRRYESAVLGFIQERR